MTPPCTAVAALCLAVALAASFGVVTAGESLLGVPWPAGFSVGGMGLYINTQQLKGLSSGHTVTVGLCGRSACCGLRIAGFYNSHPGRTDGVSYDHNNLISNSSIVGPEPDPLKLPYWLVEGNLIALTLQYSSRILTAYMFNTGCSGPKPDWSSRGLGVQCPADATQLVVESSAVGNHYVSFNGNTIRGPMLYPGQQVTLTVTVAASTSPSSLYVALCDDSQCGAVVVTNPDRRELSFVSGITTTNNPNGEFSTTYHQDSTEVVWEAGVYDFTVAYHPTENHIQVWLKPDSVGESALYWGGGGPLELKALHAFGSLSYSRGGLRSASQLPVPHLKTPIRLDSESSANGNTNFNFSALAVADSPPMARRPNPE